MQPLIAATQEWRELGQVSLSSSPLLLWPSINVCDLKSESMARQNPHFLSVDHSLFLLLLPPYLWWMSLIQDTRAAQYLTDTQTHTWLSQVVDLKSHWPRSTLSLMEGETTQFASLKNQASIQSKMKWTLWLGVDRDSCVFFLHSLRRLHM